MMPYEPYFAECPGLTALPSPPIASEHSHDAHLAKRFTCLSFHTVKHATRRKFRRWKTLVAADPLNRIAADNRIFSAG